MHYTYHKTFLDKLHEEEECSCCIDTHPATNATGRRRFSEKENTDHLSYFSSLVKEKIWYVFIYISYSTCPLKCLKHVKRRPLNFGLQDVFCFINFLLRNNFIFLIFCHHFDFWTNLVDMFCLKITAFNYNLNIRLMNAPHW